MKSKHILYLIVFISCCTLAACKLCSHRSSQSTASVDIRESKQKRVFIAPYTVDKNRPFCKDVIFHQVWIERIWYRAKRQDYFAHLIGDSYQLCFTLGEGEINDTNITHLRPDAFIVDTANHIRDYCWGDVYVYPLKDKRIPNEITLNINCREAGEKQSTITFRIADTIHTNNLMEGTIIQRTIDEK